MKRPIGNWWWVLGAALLLMPLAGFMQPTATPPAPDASSAPLRDADAVAINWQVVASGGGPGVSANFLLNGTVGQTAVGAGSSASFTLNQGFWQDFGGGSGGCCTLRGDFNDDGSVKVSDLTALINYLFRGGPAPTCLDHGDTNADGAVKVSDLTLLINYLFRGGPAPAAC
ncbi:MAG TPA: dockerin type I domain-containing protein [candidate division Zixibacteria bacterium]|nr:hypothetical protein [candidate division Zixibacteria bacterium]MDD4918602.1 dockerin type I domain-containing protein [candidate division Zixibacteria bacterium]MDM7974315.1 dockerin type I domain-containing protein [candidate division Zixibacteria bacterium]HPM37055.1 dockerin type I domain-containing protein [candidate division Zixibacteria bacterium]